MLGVVRPPCDEAIIRDAPETPGCASHAKRWVLLATIMGSSLAFLEASVINVALPAIQDGLTASVSQMQWIATAYTLILAALTLASGAAGDRFGRLRLFQWGTAVLAAASVACGLASGPLQLVLGRAAQGLGAAMLVPNSLALLSGSFPRAERGRVIGTWSAFTALTGSASPIVGGWLVDTISWRAGFLAVVPPALVTLAIGYLRVPEPPRRRSSPPVDWRGALLAIAGLGGVVFAIISSGGQAASSAGGGALAIGLAAIVAFAVVEMRTASPMVPPALFRSPAFGGVNLLTLLLYFAVTGAFFVLPFNLVQVQGYSATLTGAAFLPFAVLVAVLSRWVGGLADRIGVRPLLIGGPLVTAAGLALFALPGVGGAYWTTFLLPMTTVGLGMALTVAPLTTTVMGTVGPAEVGVASGVNNTVARIGALLAVAVVGILATARFEQSLGRRLEAVTVAPGVRQELLAGRRSLADTRLPASVSATERAELEDVVDAAFVDGFRWVMLASAAVAVGGALAVALLLGAAPTTAASEGDAMTACTHIDEIRNVKPHTRGCEECLKTGDTWVHLRLCLSCGHVGCCDSSKNRHATKHFWATKHPIVRSLEPGEDWRWCYVDEVAV